VKIVFDLQILTQQARLMLTVQYAELSYQVRDSLVSTDTCKTFTLMQPIWNVPLFGFSHPIIVVGSWAVIGTMYLLDSYIAFILGASVIGYFALYKVRSILGWVMLPHTTTLSSCCRTALAASPTSRTRLCAA
jgi:hypothetical protein